MTFKKSLESRGPCNGELAKQIETLIDQNDRIINQNNIIIDLLIKGSVINTVALSNNRE